MNTDRNQIITSALVIVGLLAIVLIWSAPRLLWIPVILAAALVAVFLHMKNKWDRFADASSAPMTPFVPFDPQPEERRVVKVDDVLLPSGQEDYSFRFSATVLWSPLDPDSEQSGLPALAVEDILRRARTITSQRDPAQVSFVRHELGGLLGRMQPVPSKAVRAMAESVRLALPEKDQERLDRLATLRKQKAVWEHERKNEQSRREYLGEDVLKDPGSAVVWWLTRNEDEVEKTVEDLRPLIQLFSAANNTCIPEHFQQYIPGLVLDGPPPSEEPISLAERLDLLLSFGEDEQSRALFIRQMVKVATEHGQQTLVEELVRYFRPPEPPAGPPETHEESREVNERPG